MKNQKIMKVQIAYNDFVEVTVVPQPLSDYEAKYGHQTFKVYRDGVEIFEVEKHSNYVERRRFPGKMYGYDLKARTVWFVRYPTFRSQVAYRTMKAAIESSVFSSENARRQSR